MGETFTLVLPLASSKLKPGDTLIVKSIDGLSENFDYGSECRSPKSIEVSALFVNTPEEEQTEKLQQIINRTNAIEHFNMKQAREDKGIKRGRKTKERPATFESVKKEWQHGKLSARKAGEKLGVSHHTFLKWVTGSSS